ncbi:hypothetical protein RPB_4124 [Rhodopseudomonas palustris HaA2]|uniref:Uncharacterized protein n=1 Tax=Rhodopseudomonas palustris (strain HaA2) TaxID=316058 RepID=Q2ISJ4_RHOP2|nr:hypothetical protein [Rhodopseudomonas palustris]ABD08816.1 hypothetical protein RPB_4124 [Rhodopseudomonas palustris HaA2]
MAQMLAPLSISDTDMPVASGGIGPWSGGVAQAINPWRFITTLMGNQFSIFSINLGRSTAPQIEAKILDEVGSYGRQIGRIGEALEVLVKEFPREGLSEQAAAALEDFSAQMREIRKIKSARA